MQVLIVKIGSVGDVIMSLVMIEELRKNYSNPSITWICGKQVEPLLLEYGKVTEIISVDENKLFKGSLFQKALTIFGIWIKLFMKTYDLTLIGHADPRYRLFVATTFSKETRSFSRSAQRIWPIPGRHHSDEYARLVRNINCSKVMKVELPHLRLPLPDYFHELMAMGENPGPIIAIAPGGAKNFLNEDEIRRWPIENYVSLAKQLLAKGFKVILSGAPSDEWIRDWFRDLNIVDVVGKTSLLDLVSIYSCCSVVVTHDSGPLHVAGLARRPVVALFGPTNPYEKAPRECGSIILWPGKGLACCPCYDGKYYAECPDKLCLKMIDDKTVLDSVLKIVNDSTVNSEDNSR